jgi:hypothetical protein
MYDQLLEIFMTIPIRNICCIITLFVRSFLGYVLNIPTANNLVYKLAHMFLLNLIYCNINCVF